MTKPLSIAFLTHEPFFPPSGGGSAEAIYLVQEMARRGHTVHLFCPQIEEAAKIQERFHIQLHQFSKWKMGRYARLRNWKYLVYPFFLKRMVAEAHRKLKFDLIFSQHAISAVAAGKLKRQLDVPVVMNFPDLLTGFMETWSNIPLFFINFLERYENSLPRHYNVDGVLSISDSLTDILIRDGFSAEKISTIYYGYDSEKFPFQKRNPSKPPVVVMHGSFDAHHLGSIAFDAMKFVAEKRPETVFRFVGKRTETLEIFLKKAKSKISGFNFQTTGFVPYDEVSKHLSDASVGIVPYEESRGTHCAFVAKVVEYAGTGLPCVCTPLESVRRYFNGNPTVCFSKFDGTDFGQKIIQSLDAKSETLESEALKLSEKVKTQLDWKSLCHKAIDFVEMTYARPR